MKKYIVATEYYNAGERDGPIRMDLMKTEDFASLCKQLAIEYKWIDEIKSAPDSPEFVEECVSLMSDASHIQKQGHYLTIYELLPDDRLQVCLD
jgi:hypothetical protein